jgi:hypothetical protein
MDNTPITQTEKREAGVGGGKETNLGSRCCRLGVGRFRIITVIIEVLVGAAARTAQRVAFFRRHDVGDGWVGGGGGVCGRVAVCAGWRVGTFVRPNRIAGTIFECTAIHRQSTFIWLEPSLNAKRFYIHLAGVIFECTAMHR